MNAGQLSVGNLSTLRFPRLLAQFWEQGFTGAFRARSERHPGAEVTKEILVERGWLAWAASDDPDESIRNYLLHRGLLRPEQWRLAEERTDGGQIRHTLLEMGFLTARELQDADRERVTAIVLSLFGWREGDYEVGPGSLPHGTPHLKLDPRDLVLEGLLSSGDRESVLEEIGSLDAVLVVRADDLVRASLSLPVELVGLMGKADGTRTIAEICALSSQPDFLISAAFAALKALGLARPLEGGPAAAPPEPPKATPARRRSRKRGSRDADPYSTTPMLPLEPAPETPSGEIRPVPATSATAAAPPEPAQPPEPEPGTVPVRSLSGILSDPDPDVVEEMPGAAPTETEEEDSGTVPVRTPPFGLPAVARATSGEDPEPAAPETIYEREGETELSPGIPVPEGAAAIPPAETMQPDGLLPEAEQQTEGLDGVEIEDAIQRLGEPEEDSSKETPAVSSAGGEPGDPGAPAGRRDEETPVEDPFGADPIPDEMEGTDGFGAFDPPPEQEEEPSAPPEGEEAPGWVYRPSGDAAPGSEPPRRWPIWAGVAVTALVIGLALTFIFRDGGAEAGAGLEAGTIQASERTLPPVEVPSAGEGSGDSAGELASAALSEPASPEPPAAQPRPATPPPATRTPPPEKANTAQASGRKAAPLAPSGPEGIFQSSAYSQGRDLLAKGRYRDAARTFATASGSAQGAYTIQLALACEAKTVERALGMTHGSTEFFILPKAHNGRECYRLVWGAYPDRTSALQSRNSVPEAFLKDRNPPFPSPL